MWVGLGRQIEDMGCQSICIKDMAGLLKPYVAFELVSRLKEACSIPIAMQSHATTGMSTTTNIKAAEAGIDMLDTATSSMSMTYGHSATESVVAILQGTERDTGLDLKLLDEIADYFRVIRKKYAEFEGSLKGVDARILVAQVPGGMLTNMEKQLRDQGAAESFDEVLKEIPRVRKDLGYIPLVTPTSQIVGTQSVLNVLLGERYKNITKETQAILKGEYGATPIPVDKELQARVLEGGKAITDRPADHLPPELQKLKSELHGIADEKKIKLTGLEDVLTYALFPRIGLKFLEHRGDASAFEPPPGQKPTAAARPAATAGQSAPAVTGPERYQVSVNGKSYDVEVSSAGAVTSVAPAGAAAVPAVPVPTASESLTAPLAGNIFRVLVKPGQQVANREVLLILEAMKMETEVRSPRAGTVGNIAVKEGDTVELGQSLIEIG
jgi:oxaloacetate decarboxylase alpha subunit